ncbi:MAG: hypothetical protein H7287_02775 [Thermoleophilia bacterium]|nr:hypothetical protein [Thermoleophilia bacterium]
MSCALANPEADVCANRRPVRGRVGAASAPQTQVAARVAAPAPLQPAALTQPARVPFAANAPEATFSIAQVREVRHPAPAPRSMAPLELFEQPVRITPPSFRDIRAGRAAAAMRHPAEVTAVVIPVAEVDAQPVLVSEPLTMPCFEQLCERVRQRTAARLSRANAPSLVST